MRAVSHASCPALSEGMKFSVIASSCDDSEISHSLQFMGGEYAQMWMIATPSKPGWCRCLWWFFAPAQTASKRTKTLARLPTWLDHQVRSAGWHSSHSVCSKIPGGSLDPEMFIRSCLVQLVHCSTRHAGLSMSSP